MSATRVHNLSVSLDGFATGEPQSLEEPFGHAGQRLHEWFFRTATFRGMGGEQPSTGEETDPDDVFASRWADGIGAEIMGAHKFGPPGWQDDPDWRGWWGDEPPFHTPVFVLTHHPRPPLEMAGGTTFHFLDASLEEALDAARQAAGGLDVRIGGGPSVVRDYLAAGLVDHLHVAVVPILLGRGVRLWDGLEGLERRYDIESVSTRGRVTHMTFTRIGR
jgi:dihydrofolate reductase